MRKPSSGSFDVNTALGASFRDPAGFVFRDRGGEILRQINDVGRTDYDLFMKSGLYTALLNNSLIVKHTETKPSSKTILTIKPQQIPFISYPFEWSFSQLRDAALLTLDIQKQALGHGMTLKDASAYNVQFLDGKPIFIDTLSFENYQPGEPWRAYRQFCQHFLAPLALMAYTDINLSQLLRVQVDGIKLDLASKLLPRRAKLKLGIAMHIAVHGKAQKAKANETKRNSSQVSQTALTGILNSLEKTVRKIKPKHISTEWGDYYDKTNYTVAAADQKAKLVEKFVKPLRVRTVLDLGGNNGLYSRVLNKQGIFTVCADVDPAAVEANYRFVRRRGETTMLPLLVDLTNPGGSLGWENTERTPINERLQCDAVMALALVHHLAISNNLPFHKIAEYFSSFGPHLVMEFVPKNDSQVQKLLATREDIFPEYNESSFKQEFGKYYNLLEEAKIPGSKRTLYAFKRKNGKGSAKTIRQ